MSTLKNIYKVTKEQYEALQSGETITINGTDYTYDNTALYLVEDNTTGIIDIADQYVRITDLDSGIYRLTYEGTKYIYYNGASSTSTISFSFINPIHLYVNKRQATADGTAYWDWHIITATSTTFSQTPFLRYVFTSISSGNTYSIALTSILESNDIKNELTYSTNDAKYVLSAYQGYLLDQNKQNKTDETLETTDKTIVGAINELNGKIGRGGGGGSSASLYKHSIAIAHSVEKDGTTYYFTHRVDCYSTDNTQATDAYSAYAYIGSYANALSSGYYGTGNQVWCINGSVGWNGGFFNVKFGAIINGAFVDFSTYMTEATYSDTVTQIM